MPATCPAAVLAWAGQSGAALESLLTANEVHWRAKVVGLLSASGNDFERALGTLLGQDGPITADRWPPVIQAAASSHEPRLVALGAQACTGVQAGPTGCPPGLVQRWVELEPSNLQPWLAVAHEAAQRQDEAAVQAALERAAAAGDTRTSWGEAQRVLTHPALQGALPMDLLPVAVEMIDIEAMASLSGGSIAARLCSETAVAEAERRAACSAIAGVMVEQGRTLVERGLGIAVGRRSGWAADRVEALAAEQHQLQAALADALPREWPGTAPLTEAQACELHRLFDALLTQTRRGDEVQTARRLLARKASASVAGR